MTESVATELEVNKMGFWACSAYLFGNVVSSGIFITPAFIVKYTMSVGLSLTIWVVCAVVSVILSLVYVELGTSILEPGADYAYAMFMGWNGTAFAFMLISVLLTYPAAIAIVCLTFGECIVQTLHHLVTFSDDPKVDAASQKDVAKAIAVLLTLLITLMNCFSLERIAARFQIVSTALKVFVVGLIIFTGFYLLIVEGRTSNFAAPFASSNWSPGALVLAMYMSLWAYGGTDILNFAVDEIHEPRRTMPRAVLMGMTAVCVTYLLINTAFFVVLTPSEMMENTQSISGVFANRAYGDFAFIVPLLVAILLLGSINSAIFCGSRMTQAGAREGQLMPFLSGVHTETGSPRPALVVQALLTIVFTFVPVDDLINTASVIVWAQKVVTAAALLQIRYRKMEVAEGALRVPIALTIILLIVSLVLVVVTVATQFWTTIAGFGMLAFAFLIYFIFFKVEPYFAENKSAPSFVKNLVRSAAGAVNKLNGVLNTLSLKLTNSQLNMKTEMKESVEASRT